MSEILKPTPEQIAAILAAHKLWLEGKADGKRANLGGAYLGGAYLGGAYLRGANLGGAYLRGAYLGGAYLPTGEKFEEYLSEVVPALLTAGGKSIDELVEAGVFACHVWSNCPMHGAFGIDGPSAGPPLLIPRINQFVHLFDQGQVPPPVKGADGKWAFPPPEYKLPDAPWAKEKAAESR